MSDDLLISQSSGFNSEGHALDEKPSNILISFHHVDLVFMNRFIFFNLQILSSFQK